MLFVPVVDKNQKPLMPTTPARARKWVKSGKATYFWKRGVYCVRLNVDPSDNKVQPIAVGIDPGSKREGFTVKSELHTYLNVQTHAVTWVKDHLKTRRIMRRSRRNRKTPYRKNRTNRLTNKKRIPPSTRSRWLWKLRISNWLLKLFPISTFVVEDIKAKTKKKCRKWNKSFSPLEVGKSWFYAELSKLGKVELKLGFETKELRDSLGLKKSKSKLSEEFEAHCVDSWVLANWYVGGHIKPDNTNLMVIIPLEFHRRELHRLKHSKGGKRPKYGGTISMGLKRGSLVKHRELGLTYVGGSSNNRVSLHDLATGVRITTRAKLEDIKFLTYNSWRTALPPR